MWIPAGLIYLAALIPLLAAALSDRAPAARPDSHASESPVHRAESVVAASTRGTP